MNDKITDKISSDLREFYKDNAWARPFFDQLSQRQRNVSESSLERICLKSDIDYESAKRLAEAMQDIGVGQYIRGRRGYKTRIVWLYSLRSIGAAAKGTSLSLESLEEDEEEDLSWELLEDSSDIEHQFRLRPDRSIKVILPSDLTQREADRLAGFIQSLPFKEDDL